MFRCTFNRLKRTAILYMCPGRRADDVEDDSGSLGAPVEYLETLQRAIFKDELNARVQVPFQRNDY